jgi:hypothetical protein
MAEKFVKCCLGSVSLWCSQDGVSNEGKSSSGLFVFLPDLKESVEFTQTVSSCPPAQEPSRWRLDNPRCLPAAGKRLSERTFAR